MASSRFADADDLRHDEQMAKDSLGKQQVALEEQKEALRESLKADHAQKRQWREEHPEEAARQDEQLRVSHEERHKEVSEQLEKARMYRETALEYDPSQHANDPRFSVTISGSPTLPLSGEGYNLTVTLHYHTSSGSQPVITFKEHGSPIWEAAAWQGVYLLYEKDDEAASDRVAVPQHFIDYDMDNDPLPVSSKHGFATIAAGDSITRQLKLNAGDFDLKAGTKYELLMPHGRLGWWGPGPMEAHKDLTVRPTDTRPDGGLIIPRSNSIKIEAVA